jgi:NAD(P)-dependent dehydrogenase (short-subunit alcohol dehydrogenase family)
MRKMTAMFGIAALSAVGMAALIGVGEAEGQQQRTVLITGSTDGLGKEVALRVAATGAHVIVHGRNRERGEAVVGEIAKAGGSARFYAADFGSFEQVRAFADAILRDYQRLDVLVNNAGIWLEGNERQLSADGHELHFQVNYLSGFLLTRRLLPLIRKSDDGRIINVSSSAQQPIDFDDVMLANRYTNGRGYSQSKLAQVMLTLDLAAELAGTNTRAYALHPATLMNTGMVLDRGMQPRSSVDDGATAVVRLITEPGLESGQYFNGTRPARANAQAYDEAVRARLRELSSRLTGIG